MALYNYFVKKISFPLILKWDGLSGILKELKFLNKSQYWSREKIEGFQFKKMKTLLTHAYENTVFYKDRFDQCNFNPHNFKDINEIEKIPYLTKDDIRVNVNQMVAQNISPSKIHMSETGGTTGVKMQFYRDNDSLPAKEAALFRFDQWGGWEFGNHYGLVWPARQDYVGHYSFKSRLKNALSKRELVFPAAIINEENVKDYVSKLLRFKPPFIRSFTSPITEVAKFILNNNIRGIETKGIVTTGEPLHKHQRALIEDAFKCKVFNSYRSREAGPLAQECEIHDGLHLNAESLYFEIISSEVSNGEDDKLGEIVITDFLNLGMPFIRYKTGDVGSILQKNCPCGRGLPLLKEVRGRVADILFTPTGKRIMGGSVVLYLVDEAPGSIGQVQVVQDKIDHLLVKITKEPAVGDEIIAYQRDIVKQIFGPEMRIDFQFVETIAREKSGKYQFTKCLINPE